MMTTEPTITFSLSMKLGTLQKLENARGETPRSKFIADMIIEKCNSSI